LPEVFQSRGLVEMLVGQFDKAEKDFSRALALGAGDTVLYYNRAVARSILGDSAGSQQDYKDSCLRGYLPACGFSKIISPRGIPTL